MKNVLTNVYRFLVELGRSPTFVEGRIYVYDKS